MKKIVTTLAVLALAVSLGAPVFAATGAKGQAQTASTSVKPATKRASKAKKSTKPARKAAAKSMTSATPQNK